MTRKPVAAQWHRGVPEIVLAEGPAGPRARIAGTGIEVLEVIRTYKNTKCDLGRYAEAFHWLTPEQLRAALAYHHLYQDEIDTGLAEEDALDIEELKEFIAARRTAQART
ncbi:MAG TPA: hypothetical protein VFA70_08820 [Dehalococcoidia bacterium]|jgi:uncharacterized protein (DUF433 family)|nr:hypothetical protein [Dehalococcoidia bacterium]